jgi:hypothetical protein
MYQPLSAKFAKLMLFGLVSNLTSRHSEITSSEKFDNFGSKSQPIPSRRGSRLFGPLCGRTATFFLFNSITAVEGISSVCRRDEATKSKFKSNIIEKGASKIDFGPYHDWGSVPWRSCRPTRHFGGFLH